MARSKDEQEKRLTALKKEVTKRGFDRHALVLKDISDKTRETANRLQISVEEHHG